LLINLSFKKPKTEASHSVIVALPLAVITVFCFAYVLTQPPQRLKKHETPTASQKPTLLTGDALPGLGPDPGTSSDLPKLPATSDLSGNSSSQTSANSLSAIQTGSPQSATTANPQAAAGASAASHLDSSSSRPTVQQESQTQLKVLPGIIKHLLGGL